MPNSNGWLLDSTVIYNEYGMELLYKTRVLSRNEFTFPLFVEFSKYNFDTEQYDFIGSSTFSYPNSLDTNEYYLIHSYKPDDYNDSIRFYYNYDDNGYYIESEEYWNQGQWGFGLMKKYKLNQSYPIYEVFEFRRLNENENWDLLEERKSFYNTDSTILTSFKYLYGETNDTTRKSVTYNNPDNNTSIIKYYKEINDSLQQYMQIEKQLNNNNQATEVIEYDIDDGIFENDRMYFYQYDANNYLSLKEDYEWDKNDSIWEYEEKISYENDLNGNILEEIKFDDIEDSLWVKEHKWTYTYDNENRKLTEVKWSANADSIWETNTLDTYSYHAGITASHMYQVWSDSLNAYWLHDGYESDFDEEDRIIEKRFYHKSESYVDAELSYTFYYNYIESENQYIEERININASSLDTINYEYKYYNKYSTGLNELANTEYSLSPNPASDFIRLESDIYHSHNLEYEIYSSLGQLIMKNKMTITENIDLNLLPKGQYIVKIYKPNGKTETLKFQKM